MNTNLNSIKELNIEEMTHKLKVGSHDGGLDLMLHCHLDGEKVVSQKGYSFVMPFVYGLHAQMHGGLSEHFFSGARYNSWNSGSSLLDNVTAANPAVIVDNSNLWDLIQDNDYAWVWGVRGTIGSVVNGLHRVKKINDGDLELYALDNTTPRDTTGLVYDGGGAACLSGFRSDIQTNVTSTYPGSNLESWKLIIGKNNTPVDIMDFGLYDKVQQGTATGYMSTTGTQVSAQVTNKPSSRFTVSRAFTNGSGGSIDINEIGLACGRLGTSGDNTDVADITGLIARDVLGSTVTVPNGSTLTVEYEVIANLSPDTVDTETDGTNGGFLDDFIQSLRAIGSETSTNTYRNRKKFFAGSSPGDSATDGVANPLPGYRRGIRVGTDQTFTSMTDESLISLINHGEADGELYHYGSFVENDIAFDLVNDKATITVSRIFENRGSTDVTIKELGLFLNDSENSNEYNADLMARTALKSTDWYTVTAGSFVKINYEIEITA